MYGSKYVCPFVLLALLFHGHDCFTERELEVFKIWKDKKPVERCDKMCQYW